MDPDNTVICACVAMLTTLLFHVQAYSNPVPSGLVALISITVPASIVAALSPSYNSNARGRPTSYCDTCTTGGIPPGTKFRTIV